MTIPSPRSLSFREKHWERARVYTLRLRKTSEVFGLLRKTSVFFGNLRKWLCSVQNSRHCQDKNLTLISQKKLAGINFIIILLPVGMIYRHDLYADTAHLSFLSFIRYKVHFVLPNMSVLICCRLGAYWNGFCSLSVYTRTYQFWSVVLESGAVSQQVSRWEVPGFCGELKNNLKDIFCCDYSIFKGRLCTLCFYFPTKMLRLNNAPFFH